MKVTFTLAPAEAELLQDAEALIGARKIWLSYASSHLAKLATLTLARAILRGSWHQLPFPLAFDMRFETQSEREFQTGRPDNIIAMK